MVKLANKKTQSILNLNLNILPKKKVYQMIVRLGGVYFTLTSL